MLLSCSGHHNCLTVLVSLGLTAPASALGLRWDGSLSLPTFCLLFVFFLFSAFTHHPPSHHTVVKFRGLMHTYFWTLGPSFVEMLWRIPQPFVFLPCSEPWTRCEGASPLPVSAICLPQCRASRPSFPLGYCVFFYDDPGC